MKKMLFVIAGILFTTHYAAYSQNHWAQKAGGQGADAGRAVTSDNLGNIYTTGVFYHQAIFGATTISTNIPGSNDVFVAKYNSHGASQWVQHGGGSGTAQGNAIALDGSGNVIIAGFFEDTAFFGNDTLISIGQKDIFIAKTDNNGNLLWAKNAGGIFNDEATGISTDGTGNIYVTGYFNTTAYFLNDTLSSNGILDIFIAKYDAAGNFKWGRNGGGAGPDVGNAITTDATGNSYLTGFMHDTAYFGNKTLISYGAGASQDILIAEYDSSGNVIWVKNNGGAGSDAGQGIALDGSGNAYVTGTYYTSGDIIFDTDTIQGNGANDIFVAIYGSSGNLIKLKKDGGQKDEIAQSVSVDFVGDIFVTGQFADTSNFSSVNLYSHGMLDIFVVNYNSNFNLLNIRSYGGPLNDYGYGINTDASGIAVSTGSFYLNSFFGSTNLTSVGNSNSDIYLTTLYGLTQQVNGFNAQRFYVANCGMSSDDLVASAKDKFNNLINCMNSAEVNVFDGNMWYIFDTTNFYSAHLTSVFADNNGDWWVGSTDKGLFKYSSGIWTVYDTSASIKTASNHISAISKSPSGNLIVGYADAGIDVFDGTSFTNYNTSSGLPGNKISAIGYDSSYTYWIGTIDSGIALFNGTAVTATFNTSNTALLPGDSIACFTFENSKAWIGTSTAGIATYNGSTWTPYTQANSSLPDDQINAMLIKQNTPGTIWLATKKKGVVIFDGSLLTTFNTGNVLFDNNTTSLSPAAGGVWAGTQYNGLIKIIETNGIDELNNNNAKISCAPNPARDFTIVNFNSDKDSKTVLWLTDVSGKKVFEYNFNHLVTGDYSYRLDLKKFSEGVYIAHLQQGEREASDRLIVTK